jgi:gentisate 1,2-dioxygenase
MQDGTNRGPVQEDFFRRIGEDSLAPLWKVLAGLVTDEPKTTIRAHRWRYDEVRPFLLEAAELVTTQEAERRVLVLENPDLPGQSRITRSLFGGLQIIMPNEIAPPHRHVAAALRFVIEGEGAYTSVDGERSWMKPGDFIITPSWTWHDHGNHGKGPVVWLDGLDMHMVNLYESSFREADERRDAAHEPTKPDGDSLARFGANLAPIEHGHVAKTSPIFSYPYDRTKAALLKLREAGPADPHFGYKMRYINPLDGGWAMPTIATCMQFLPAGFKTQPYRATDSTVFVGVEGKGRTTIGGETFEWGPRDVVVVPSWVPYTIEADADAFVFSYSDRAAQEKLGFWREEKIAA